jgi:membrane protein DedA with SNARE-associated domain
MLDNLPHFLHTYGYLSLGMFLFLEATGFPIPGSLVLLTAGAACAQGLLHPAVAWTAALGATLTGDILLYLIGRYTGWGLLGFLCRISLNPESCILSTAGAFYKRGRKLLLFAKFVPGINTMAPPLAGTMNMSPDNFLVLDMGGATLYTTTFFAAGFVFSGFLTNMLTGARTLGSALEWLLGTGLVLYLAHRLRLLWTHRTMNASPRMEVATVANLIQAGEEDATIVDVRSHGYYNRDAVRIRGSIRLDPNSISDALAEMPKGRKLFLYCT